MTVEQLLFLAVALVTLLAAIMVVTNRSLIYSALWLIVALFGVAVFYVLLDAGFLAVAQVVIYIGAIAILLIFAIMLTQNVAVNTGSQINRYWPIALVIGGLLFAGILFMLFNWSGFSTQMPDLSPRANPLVDLGTALVNPDKYVLAFELASVMLLAALVGAILIAWERK